MSKKSLRTTIHVPTEMSLPRAIAIARRSNGSVKHIILCSDRFVVDRIILDFPVTITGKGPGKSIIQGQIIVEGNKKLKNNLCLKQLTITNPAGGGVWNDGGLPLVLDNVEITRCRFNGVYVAFGVSASLIKCHIHRCQTGLCVNGFGTAANVYDLRAHHNMHSGIWASNNSLVNVYGPEGTSIHHNGCVVCLLFVVHIVCCWCCLLFVLFWLFTHINSLFFFSLSSFTTTILMPPYLFCSPPPLHSLQSTNAYGIIAQHHGTCVRQYGMVEGNGPSRENTKGRNEREKNGGKIIYVESNGDELEELNDSKTKFVLRVPEDYPTLRECVAATSKLRETHLILIGEGVFYNLDENEEDENGENGGRPLIINHPIKIEGKGRNTTILRFGIIGLSGMLELENLSLMNPNGIGIWGRSASSVVSLDTVEVHSCHSDGVRVSDGATLTCVECHFHHNGGCGLVVGDDMPKSKQMTDGGRIGESKEEKSSSDDFADVAFDDDGSGGSGGSGGGGGDGGR